MVVRNLASWQLSHRHGMVAAACRLVESGAARQVQIVLKNRPAYAEMVSFQQSACANHVTLTVDRTGTIKVSA